MYETLIHYASPTFWERFKELPENVKKNWQTEILNF